MITDKVSFSHWVDLKKLNNFTVKSMEKSFKYRANILEHDLSNLYKNVNGYKRGTGMHASISLK